eukprot:scaffold60206_cov31-Prasinocladus_malaysianus.AAC.1
MKLHCISLAACLMRAICNAYHTKACANCQKLAAGIYTVAEQIKYKIRLQLLHTCKGARNGDP